MISPTQPITRFPLLHYYLFFLFFPAFYQVLVFASGMAGFTGLRQTILMSLLWLLPVLIFPRWARSISALAGLLLWAASMVGVGYWLIYGQEFSQSVLYIIFESNTAEGSEFLLSYLRWWDLPFLLGYSLLGWWLWRTLPALEISNRRRGITAVIIALVVSWPFSSRLVIKQEGVQAALYHQLHRMQPAPPWSLAVGYYKYRQELAGMERLLSANSALAPLEDFHSDPAPNTLILVIGESTNRGRMGLYGYLRDTTPKLSALGEGLQVFRDVVSPRPYTIETLQQVLSFADEQHPDAFMTQPNLLNMMHQAGYHITWITNQQTQTRRNTMLTTLSQMADRQVYLNNNRSQDARQFDSVVLTPLTSALNAPHPRKLVVVHLLGTHRNYHYRYPDPYARFSDRTGVPEWVGDDVLEEYNSYDNAIAFNDFVVSSIVAQAAEQSAPTAMVYLSDHGEEVYDTPGRHFAGRNESTPTPAMYDVPFLLYTNPAWRQQRPVSDWSTYLDRAYSTSDFIYSWADLAGIDFRGMNRSRSLFSEEFRPHTRWIGDPGQPTKLRSYEEMAHPTAQRLHAGHARSHEGVL